ncbi:heat-inducible transcription repressor HrcA [bacterium]|nr:heat-inducible transcription repressor HrcA [bacterium]
MIQSHIQTAAPISSDHVVRVHDLSFSPATIRNDMASLESKGYLQQPHTSAGRIPTDKAYRFYVDSLMRREKLSQDEKHRIDVLIDRQGNVSEILNQASRILGHISSELAVVLTPFMSHAVFDHMELVGLTERKILVVIHVRSRSVKTIILQVDSETQSGDLEKTASFLNERLSGLSLGEIKNSIRERCQDISPVQTGLIRVMIDSADQIFDLNEPIDMRTSGTSQLLSQPEFSDKGILEALFEILEDRSSLSSVLKQDRAFQVVIGQEHEDERLKPFSVISAQYQIGDDAGTIGVIGPKRMRYSKILPLVERMARTISDYLS